MNKEGEKAAEGMRRRDAEIEEWLKTQPPSSPTELTRAIVLASLDGSSHDILYDRRHARGSNAKTISKSLSIPLEDVQLVLKAFKKFMQSTADQLARKAVGSKTEP
jgi:hypothetical protein